jgi:hypothetical protein
VTFIHDQFSPAECIKNQSTPNSDIVIAVADGGGLLPQNRGTERSGSPPSLPEQFQLVVRPAAFRPSPARCLRPRSREQIRSSVCCSVSASTILWPLASRSSPCSLVGAVLPSAWPSRIARPPEARSFASGPCALPRLPGAHPCGERRTARFAMRQAPCIFAIAHSMRSNLKMARRRVTVGVSAAGTSPQFELNPALLNGDDAPPPYARRLRRCQNPGPRGREAHGQDLRVFARRAASCPETSSAIHRRRVMEGVWASAVEAVRKLRMQSGATDIVPFPIRRQSKVIYPNMSFILPSRDRSKGWLSTFEMASSSQQFFLPLVQLGGNLHASFDVQIALPVPVQHRHALLRMRKVAPGCVPSESSARARLPWSARESSAPMAACATDIGTTQ